jgi:Gly-Xaa carboxypeptidase
MILRLDTDTKHYWNLTSHIYRYAHISGADMYTPSGIHSVNEALKATAFVDVIRWYTRLILNADESDM